LGRRAQPGGHRGGWPGAGPARVVRRGFTEGPHRLGFRPHHGGKCGGMRKAGTLFIGEAAVCPPQAVGRLWRGNVAHSQSSGEAASPCVSRGADYAVRGGKPKSRAGRVRPAVAVWRRGRQDAARFGKKSKHGRLGFFVALGPPPPGGGGGVCFPSPYGRSPYRRRRSFLGGVPGFLRPAW
jgi:hypothetical protein